ncbi:MAG TPA: AI-2E family transporter [Herpetosiphonaceae bacterium]|nr:AI-2E family transporter [Herpetosiphonaceae bacterium]
MDQTEPMGRNVQPAAAQPASPDINWPVVLRTAARWALVVGVVALIVWLLYRAGATVAPFIFGFVLAYLLLPIVKRLDRILPRWGSITAVYLVGFILFELALIFIVPPAANQVSQAIRNAPEWFQEANAFVNTQLAQFQASASPEVREQVDTQVRNIQGTLQSNASSYAQRVAAFLAGAILGIFDTLTFLFGFLVVPFFLFYILNDSDKLGATIDRFLYRRVRADFWNIWRIVDSTLGQYIRGQLLLGLVIGIVSFLGLNALNLFFGFDIPYTVVLALVAAVGELIPVVGPILAAIPAVAVALGGGWQATVAVIVLYVLIQQLENQILVPRIVGNTLRLHPAVLLALLVIAGGVGGLPLVILAAPLAAIGRDVVTYLYRRLSEPPAPPEIAAASLVPEEVDRRPARRARVVTSQSR